MRGEHNPEKPMSRVTAQNIVLISGNMLDGHSRKSGAVSHHTCRISSTRHGFLDTKLRLKAAMEEAGIMEAAMEEGKKMKRSWALKVVAEVAPKDTNDVTRGASREIAKLRNIQLEEAQIALVSHGGQPSDVVARATNSKRPRGKKPRKTRLSGHAFFETLLGMWQRGWREGVGEQG